MIQRKQILVWVELHTHWLMAPKNLQAVPASDFAGSSLPDSVFLHSQQCFPLFWLHSKAGSLHMVRLDRFRLAVLTVAVTLGKVASSSPCFHQKL